MKADSFISAASFQETARVLPKDEPPPPPPVQPTDDELELERDMEYFVEPDEALAPRTGDLGE